MLLPIFFLWWLVRNVYVNKVGLWAADNALWFVYFLAVLWQAWLCVSRVNTAIWEFGAESWGFLALLESSDCSVTWVADAWLSEGKEVRRIHWPSKASSTSIVRSFWHFMLIVWPLFKSCTMVNLPKLTIQCQFNHWRKVSRPFFLTDEPLM